MSVTIERHSNLRAWTYTVHISEVDGRVLRVTAGCRTWKSFDIAQDHYRGDGPYIPRKWADEYITSRSDTMKFELRAYRWEARMILQRLQEAALVRGERIRAQRLRERKARRKHK